MLINNQFFNTYNIPLDIQQKIQQLPFIPKGRIRKDWTGQIQGRLLILGRAPKPSNINDTRAFWWAVCLKDFNIIKLSSKSLANGTSSCGCLQKEKAAQNAIKRNTSDKKPGHGNQKDLTGQKFGRLIALEPTSKKENGSIIWKCECQNDGNITYVQSHLLLNGSVKSCGCLISAGETKIEHLLQKHNIRYIKQYSFPDLKGQRNFPLRFDFGILDEDNNLKYLIEYDGIQHFIYTGKSWNTKEHFDYTKRHDLLKEEYCKNHNIPLIRIKYDKYDILTIKDLLIEV